YSIRENKWMTFQNILPSPLCHCVAILSEDSTHVHIIGGENDKYDSMSTHMKTEVREWLSEEEMKKGTELKVEEEKEIKKNEVETIVNKVKKDNNNANEMNEKGQNENDIIVIKYIYLSEINKKWMKWWNQREKNDKTEIIQKFKTMPNEQFKLWLLDECKWKNQITKDDITSILFSIDVYLALITANEDRKEEKELTTYVKVDERETLIKMKELTFEELLCQSYHCLEWKDIQKMRNKHVKLDLENMKGNIIESDKD
ncbi:hypothetical protein RFI_36394, partial [Reticulomyxa filosa]